MVSMISNKNVFFDTCVLNMPMLKDAGAHSNRARFNVTVRIFFVTAHLCDWTALLQCRQIIRVDILFQSLYYYYYNEKFILYFNGVWFPVLANNETVMVAMHWPI